jgi:Peptidase family S51
MIQLIPKPIFLLSDSLLLFSRDGGPTFLSRVVDVLDAKPPVARAAYLGASNGDAPEYFDMFRAAMEQVGIEECVHVHAAPDRVACAFLDSADLILLAGGDVEMGWRAFEKAGLVDRIRSRSMQGAVLVGVSAGAVQLGTCVSVEPRDTLSLLSLVPYAVGVREEPEWPSLVSVVKRRDGEVVGLGIPAGGGVVVHADLSVEPVRQPITEVSLHDEVLRVREVLSVPSPQEDSGIGPELDRLN